MLSLPSDTGGLNTEVNRNLSFVQPFYIRKALKKAGIENEMFDN